MKKNNKLNYIYLDESEVDSTSSKSILIYV